MTILKISGNIHKEYTLEFSYKNQDIEISVNDSGSTLQLHIDGNIMHDLYGDAHTWEFNGHLHGAAKTQNTIRQLRNHAIYLIDNFIV